METALLPELFQVLGDGKYRAIAVKLNLLSGAGRQWGWMRFQRLGLGLSTNTATGEQYKQAETGGAQ